MSRVLSTEQAKAALDKAKQELEQRRGQLQKILQGYFLCWRQRVTVLGGKAQQPFLSRR